MALYAVAVAVDEKVAHLLVVLLSRKVVPHHHNLGVGCVVAYKFNFFLSRVIIIIIYFFIFFISINLGINLPINLGINR